MSPFTDARMHLGIELGGAGHHPGAARFTGQDPADSAGVRHHLSLVLAAARRGLDFVAIPEPPVGGPDALALATRIAPLASGVGLVPAAPVGGADPAALGAAVTALDAASSGRSGWQPRAAAGQWPHVAELLERMDRRLPDTTGDGLRSLNRRPLVVLRADDPDSLPVVGRWADVARVSAAGLDDADAARARVRAAVAAAGRDPDEIAVMLDVEVHLAADRHRAQADLVRLDAVQAAEPSSVRVLGTPADVADLIGATVRLGAADGITLLPLVLPDDLRRIADDLVPVLAGRGLLRTGWSGLRRPVRVPVPAAVPVAGVAGKASA
jgi:alkanesulfonate monooxygenase SsuD/methylene tetrahydromethanopterin reductase-like flavin-dependent oxidoreductase (luciferase family)